jgi:hypothetical protein
VYGNRSRPEVQVTSARLHGYVFRRPTAVFPRFPPICSNGKSEVPPKDIDALAALSDDFFHDRQHINPYLAVDGLMVYRDAGGGALKRFRGASQANRCSLWTYAWTSQQTSEDMNRERAVVPLAKPRISV